MKRLLDMKRVLALVALLVLTLPVSAQDAASLFPCPTPYTGNLCIGAGDRDVYLMAGGTPYFKVDRSGSVAPLSGSTPSFPGALTVAGTVTVTGGGFAASTASGFVISTRSFILSSANKLHQFTDNTGATGLEQSYGSATLGTCTAGTIVTGSHNFAGGYTGNTSGSCVINFGTPNFTNAPFCFAMSTASTTHPRISAASTSSITVTGGVSGETIQYLCIGRIGV
jgi:hypothetical protein